MQPLAKVIAEQGRLDAADAMGWIVRLAKTLTPLHRMGIAHGRLGGRAILVEGSSCQLQGSDGAWSRTR